MRRIFLSLLAGVFIVIADAAIFIWLIVHHSPGDAWFLAGGIAVFYCIAWFAGRRNKR